MTREDKIRQICSIVKPKVETYYDTVLRIRNAVESHNIQASNYIIHKSAHRIRKRMYRPFPGKWSLKYNK